MADLTGPAFDAQNGEETLCLALEDAIEGFLSASDEPVME